MASSPPVAAPSPKSSPPPPPPLSSPPPPSPSSPPPIQSKTPPPSPDQSKTPPPLKSPSPPPSPPPPPDEPIHSPPPPLSSPPPDESKKSPPPDESPPPPPPTTTPPAPSIPTPTPTLPSNTPPPPSSTLPPSPLQPSSPPPPSTSTNIPQSQPTTFSPPPPAAASQNPIILTPPTPGINVIVTPPTSPGNLFPLPPLPFTPSSGSIFSAPNAPSTLKAPPHTPSSSSNSASNNTEAVGDKLPLIIEITTGAGLLFIALIAVFLLCLKKQKKRGPTNNPVQYYGNLPTSEGGGYYTSNSVNQPKWYNSNNQQMMEHGSNMMAPSLPPGLLVPPPGAGWGNQQQQQYLVNSSGSYQSGSNAINPPQHMVLPASPGGGLSISKSSFSYDDLAAATNGFSQDNLLGQGGFGYVHKGVLPNGKVVAVKSLKSGSGQGEREFQAEVEIITRVHHRHLVSLVGYCIAGGQRMLVYEFVPNKTLEYHLHGKGRPTMEWSKRIKIALGAAKGLAYLHEDCHPRIIHRDIKTANILIDNKFEAMVADFGLAKLSSDTYTHVSTRIMGTFGYLAPEYASSGKLTDKSDVFSFGVMLLELITGRRPVDTSNRHMEDSLVDWARPLLTRVHGDYRDLVDPRLENNFDVGEMSCMVACAAASIRHSARRRPKMSQIVRALEGDISLEMLNEGGKLGQMTEMTSSEHDEESYNSNMEKFRKMAMAGTSEEIGSVGYNSGVTSTYGLDPSSSSDYSSGEVVVVNQGQPHPRSLPN